jgi:hypothetical protein
MKIMNVMNIATIVRGRNAPLRHGQCWPNFRSANFLDVHDVHVVHSLGAPIGCAGYSDVIAVHTANLIPVDGKSC